MGRGRGKAMKQRTRIPRKRATPRNIHPERSGSHRIRLRTRAEKEARRRELFERSDGRCEDLIGDPITSVQTQEGIVALYFRCNRRINIKAYDPAFNPQGMEWSHRRHGSNKCDCMDCGIASCHECHVKRHNCGGKPCPKKVKVSA